MTLPSSLNRPSVDFNNFDVMASSNINDSMFEQQALEQEPQFFSETQPATQSSSQICITINHNNNKSNGPTSNELINSHNSTSPPAEDTITPAVATAATTIYSSNDLAVESVMPGIYFTKNFIAWNKENLRAHGFTHIIIIDKHIQELYYPSPVFRLSSLTKNKELYESTSPFDYYCSAPMPRAATSLNFSEEFEAIDLNFGEKSYLTTVLPNCYRAVRFISKALQCGGTILVIDCNGGEQKCLTIIVAYLMYKHNINFSDAFARLKAHYEKADLDRFYVSQLYEYEPILQVQRAQSRGHSCSREMHAAALKRKKVDDDDFTYGSGDIGDYILSTGTTKNEFLQSFNPLAQFNANMMAQTAPSQQQQEVQRTNDFHHISKQQLTMTNSLGSLRHNCISTEKNNYHPNVEIVNNNQQPTSYDDYAME